MQKLLFSLTKADLEAEESNPSKALNIINSLLRRRKKLLATILVANNFINIGIVILFAALSERLFSGIDSKINLILFKIDLVFFVEAFIITFSFYCLEKSCQKFMPTEII